MRGTKPLVTMVRQGSSACVGHEHDDLFFVDFAGMGSLGVFLLWGGTSLHDAVNTILEVLGRTAYGRRSSQRSYY